MISSGGSGIYQRGGRQLHRKLYEKKLTTPLGTPMISVGSADTNVSESSIFARKNINQPMNSLVSLC